MPRFILEWMHDDQALIRHIYAMHSLFFSPMKALKDKSPFVLLSVDETLAAPGVFGTAKGKFSS
jgi:hypothetical protein